MEKETSAQVLAKATSQKKATLVSFLCLLILVLLATLWMMMPFVLAVLMGGILSLMLRPLFLKLQTKKLGPKVSAALVTVGVVILIIVPIVLLVSVAVKQGIAVGNSMKDNGSISIKDLTDQVGEWRPIKVMFESPEAFETQAREWIQNAGKAATAAILGIAGSIPEFLVQLILASIACFFLLVDGKRFMEWSASRIPLSSDVRKEVAASFCDTAISTIWATLAGAATQSVIMLCTFFALGVPAAFLACGMTFVLSWIPLVGCSPVWILGGIYLLTQGFVLKALIIVILGLGAGITDNIIRPAILKGRSKIHPLVSLLAIFGGISFFGIMGVFIGPVLAAVLISLLQIWPDIGARFGLIQPNENSPVEKSTLGVPPI